MRDENTPQEDEPYVAVVVKVPGGFFSDDDDICLQAATHVCSLLERRLLQAGHTVKDWLKGGCAADWGVYYESTLHGEVYQYFIGFFPDERGTEQRLIVVQFRRKPKKRGILSALFGKPRPLESAPLLLDLMAELGGEFEEHRMLTQAQLDREY